MQQDETDQSENTWLTPNEVPVQSLQPLRLQNSTEAADAFFDFDLESPGSPIDECEYTRLIETTTVTPNEPVSTAQQETESGYVCASPCSSLPGSDGSQTSSHNNSSDLPYYDPESSDTSATFYDCIESRKDFMKLHNTSPESPTRKLPEDEQISSSSPTKSSYIPNGHIHAIILDSDTSCSESLPQSQSTDSNLTYTPFSSTSASNNTLQDDESIPELQTDDKKIETDLNDNVTSKKSNKIFNGELEELACEHINEPTIECKVVVETVKTLEKNDMEIPKREKSRLTSITETDEEEEDEKPQRLRRSSSLKSGKTPPGTPGRKKIVRFADVLGLDLADVKTFLDNDLPIIPKSAYEDLDYKEDVIRDQNPVNSSVNKILVPLFQQPGGLPNFLDRVRENQVCLENCAVTDPITLTICGSVRVRNLDFHKSVYIRYSIDSWKSFSDLQANYVVNSCDGFSDKFTFTMFGNALQIGQRIEMAIRFHCRGQQFWDSNYDSNYCFQCLPVNQEPKPQQVKTAFAPTQNDCSGAFY